MGRIRTIKPEILLDRKAQNLPDDAWRLWVSMWVIADDLGRLPADPALLAGQVFWGKANPLEACSRALASLRESSMLAFYTVRGEEYAEIQGWKRHQKIDRPSGPKFPIPDQPLSAQTSLQIANTREASRSLDPDHDRDHDRDHDPDQPKQNTNTSGDPERVRDMGSGSVSQGASEQVPPPEGTETPIVAPDASQGHPARSQKARAKVAVVPEDLPDEALTLAHLLLDAICRNNPTGRTASTPERRKPEIALRWAQTIDKLHRIDGQPWATIEAMIAWCQRDSFWRGVILGADNLREKWDTMVLQRERRPGQPVKRGPTAIALSELEHLEGKANQ